MEGLPFFDFHNPWVALIQIALIYVLPRLVGLVTDKFSATNLKIVLLLALSLITSALTWLLDVAIANSWADADWTALINVIVTAFITWALANGIFKGVIVPSGAAARDAESNVIQLFGPSKARLALTGPAKSTKKAA